MQNYFCETSTHILFNGFNVSKIYKDHVHDNLTNFYVSTVLGMGKQDTQIATTSLPGTAYLLPLVSIGAELSFSKNLSFIFELGVENLRTDEQFSDGETQSTNVSNFTLSAGIVF